MAQNLGLRAFRRRCARIDYLSFTQFLCYIFYTLRMKNGITIELGTPEARTDANDNSVTEDQRGQPRSVGRADIGALESDYAARNPGPGTSLLLLD